MHRTRRLILVRIEEEIGLSPAHRLVLPPLSRLHSQSQRARHASILLSRLVLHVVRRILRELQLVLTMSLTAVICRVCQQSVKRSGVLCQECSLIAHARCVADAPASCDIRAQLLLYSQYSQRNIAQEHPLTTQEATSPTSPSFLPSRRRPSASEPPQSDSSISGSSNIPGRLPSRRKWWKRSAKSPEPSSPLFPPVTGPSSQH